MWFCILKHISGDVVAGFLRSCCRIVAKKGIFWEAAARIPEGEC